MLALKGPGTPWTPRMALHAMQMLDRWHFRLLVVMLRFARNKFTVPLFHAASKRYCKGKGKNTFCAPKSLSHSRLCFSIPMGACCCRVVGALVGSFQASQACLESHCMQCRCDRWHFRPCAPFGLNFLLAEHD